MAEYSGEMNGSTGDGQPGFERALAARRRADTYRLLAEVFAAEPTSEMIDSLRQLDVVSAFQSVGIEIADELNRLENQHGRSGMLEELQCEYTRLFLGPGKHVGPYESLHRPDEQPQYWGPSTATVKRFIEHHGLSYDTDFHGMPDHISAEFQFIAVIAEAEAEAIDQGDEDTANQARQIQQVFHREHIACWVPGFCDKVVELAELDFYREMAKLAKAVVELDATESAV